VIRCRDDNQQQLQDQQQQQQGWLDSTLKFHVEFGLLKLLMIAHFHSMYIICEVIYLISLIEVTGSVSPNRVYWYLYIISETLGFELLLWTNLSLVMWLVINFCLLMYALASSGQLAHVSSYFP